MVKRTKKNSTKKTSKAPDSKRYSGVEDDLDEMDRTELKAYIKDNDLDVRVTKSMDEDDIREAIRDAVGDGDDEDEDEEDERPAKGRKRRTKTRDEDEDEGDDDDDEDEDEDDGTVGSGWGDYKKNKSKTSSYPDRFAPDEESRLIKFLDDEPFSTYNQHWIERDGKKSFICLGDDCPLCDIGDDPTAYAVFNIIDLSEGKPSVKIIEARPRLAGQIEKKHKDKRYGPLSKSYYAITRTGKGSKSATELNPVKERDLEEDYDTEPLTAADLKRLRKDAWDSSSVVRSSRKDLREVAREVADDD